MSVRFLVVKVRKCMEVGGRLYKHKEIVASYVSPIPAMEHAAQIGGYVEQGHAYQTRPTS